ncbi:hypothetical protein [Caloranaerobacter sp. DY30410]|uniref:hypothetical protein n=1 Tax=Caloranaerobacter sp. DY30410 TaxID=3238305 RepID=UPI003CFEDEFF
MSFYNRTQISNALIKYMKNFYWNNDIIKNKYKIFHHPYGYETHINNQVRETLISKTSNTAKHIRFTPDYLLIQSNNTNDFLLEYKVTKTPRYIFGDKQWNIGQIEADALENYLNLINAGINVAVLVYCPYHPRPLLCDIPNERWITSERLTPRYSSGSGTDYYNINLSLLNTFDDFMKKFFSIPANLTTSLLNKQFFNMLKNDSLLKIEHAEKSPYKNKVTGFNWTDRYK